MKPVVAALDVGGTSIKAALIDRDGRVQSEVRRETGVENGPGAVVEGIVELAQELTRTPGAEVVGVGVGVPGMVDSAAGIARYAANLGWSDVPLAKLIADRTGRPVALAHDVRTAVLAEARLGAGIDATSMYFIAIGTGIAGGLATAGVVDDGANGMSGEIGHLVVRPGGPPCQCGNLGCLEAIASASRIANRYRALTDRPDVSAREIATRVEAGEAAAQQIWAEAVDALADAMAAVTILQDPEIFVLGGGLSLSGGTLTRPLALALGARLTFRTPPPITLSRLGDRAGLRGAGLRAWDYLEVLSGQTI